MSPLGRKEKVIIMSSQDRNDIKKELNNISHLYNYGDEAARETAGHGQETIEQEMDTITKLYNL